MNGGQILSMLLLGMAIDRYGERSVVALTMIAMGLSAFGAAKFGTSYSSLLLFLTMLGAWYAAVQPGGTRAIIRWFPPQMRGFATGVRQAGLAAPAVAASLRGLQPSFIPTVFYAKGNYFSCKKRTRFSHLIYPVPEAAGLGVHLTLDLAGQARFGPDVEWVNKLDFQVDTFRAYGFYEEIRKYWPGLPDDALQAAYCGIRPKLSRSGGVTLDFRIDDSSFHGASGLINLYGIESPGLTSALAIADYIVDIETQKRF